MKFPEEIRIGPSPTGKGCRLESVQFLPVGLDELFAFFSNAFELEGLTPAWLNFRVTTPAPIVISVGTRINYRLRLRGIPLGWQSLISVWEPPFRFVDEQVHGPYRRWYHEHRFETVAGGTVCYDTVDYAVYGGALIERWLVRPDLLKIFAYRREQLEQRFGTANSISHQSEKV